MGLRSRRRSLPAALCVPVGGCDFLIGRLGLSTAGESEFSTTNFFYFYWTSQAIGHFYKPTIAFLDYFPLIKLQTTLWCGFWLFQ